MNDLGDNLLSWLNAALDLSYQRGNIIAGNLANVDTPDFTPQDLDFEEALIGELGSRGPVTELPMARVFSRADNEAGLDGNKVDLDQEMTNMAANKLFYELSSNILKRKLALLRYSIDEGGR
jgi:flagellar basal-body rod protein FlgB